jgi:hypothetical protein
MQVTAHTHLRGKKRQRRHSFVTQAQLNHTKRPRLHESEQGSQKANIKTIKNMEKGNAYYMVLASARSA